MESLIILGFDVRRPIAQQNATWTDERRSKFLIRHELRSTISVDRDVWPALALNVDEMYPLYLWGSLSEVLMAFPEAARLDSDSPIVIEIAAVCTQKEPLMYWEGIICGRLNLEEDRALKVTTECLGYDVADRCLVSGLSNCMLSEEELAVIRKDWATAINTWGLFGDSKAAEVFREVCNRLVPEHAPFEVYRMRKVEIAPSG